MFSLNNIILPKLLESKLLFLVNLDIQFGGFAENIRGDSTHVWIPVLIFFGFTLTLALNNSIQTINNFQHNYKTVLLAGLAFTLSILSLNKATEFLYFNF
jgi:hypothetical protein